MQRRTFLKASGATTAALGGVGVLTGSAVASGQPMVWTRDHFDDDGNLINGHTRYCYSADDIFGDGTYADSDMTLMVHGWDLEHWEAVDKAEKAAYELDNEGYDGTVVGYSWDSDKGGWGDAKHIAHRNGKKIANVINYLK